MVQAKPGITVWVVTSTDQSDKIIKCECPCVFACIKSTLLHNFSNQVIKNWCTKAQTNTMQNRLQKNS